MVKTNTARGNAAVKINTNITVHMLEKQMGKLLICLILVSIFCGCQTLPESRKNAEIILRKDHRISPEVIEALILGNRINNKDLEYLSNNPSVHVRFLVASNKFIDEKLMKKFELDRSIYVKSGLACNTSLSKNMMYRLSKQQSWDINSNLVKNSSAPEDLLLAIYRNSSDYQKSLLLLSYSKNPKIPTEICNAINTSNDEPAKENLLRMRSIEER